MKDAAECINLKEYLESSATPRALTLQEALQKIAEFQEGRARAETPGHPAHMTIVRPPKREDEHPHVPLVREIVEATIRYCEETYQFTSQPFAHRKEVEDAIVAAHLGALRDFPREGDHDA